ncbi:MAG: DMT family transporter [Candidatus Levybacteria bacterium]|nr:DMT family transporter [Candidatus Levybacteria bacterium]
MSDRQIAFLAVFLGSLMGGAVTTATKIGLVSIPPLTFAFLRFFIASVIILPLFFKKYNFSIKQLKKLIPFTLFATLNIILFIVGIRTTTATIGQLLYAGTPFITSLILFILFNDRQSISKSIGIIVGFIGVAIVAFLPVLEQGKPFAGDLIGNLLIAGGVLSWSFYIVFSKKYSKDYSPFLINSVFILITTIILFPIFIVDFWKNNEWISIINFPSILSLGYVAIFGTIITYLLNQYAIKHGGSVFASMSFYLLPIFAFIAAFVLLSERLTLGLLIGGTLALLGIYLSTRK